MVLKQASIYINLVFTPKCCRLALFLINCYFTLLNECIEKNFKKKACKVIINNMKREANKEGRKRSKAIFHELELEIHAR